MQNNTILKVYRDKNNQLSFDEIELPPAKDHLPFFYNQIDCSTIDIITRKIGKRYFDLVIDDEGKITHKEITAVMLYQSQIYDELAGSFLITTHDDEGNTLPLTQEDIEYIKNNVRYITAFDKDMLFTISVIDLRY